MNTDRQVGISDWRRSLALLLNGDGGDGRAWQGFAAEEWVAFLRIARRNAIVVRSQEKLEKLSILPGKTFREAAIAESERIHQTVAVIGQIGEICEQQRMPHVFTKAFQHYPDMGHDIDLLVMDRVYKIDVEIGKALELVPERGSLANRFARKTSYRIRGCPSPLEIHHGCLGHLGEHNRYPRMLVERSREFAIGAVRMFIPSPEDRVIIQALQRMYGHFHLRVGDVLAAVAVLTSGPLDWDYILRTSERIGIRGGLACYLSCVEAACRPFVKDLAIDSCALGGHKAGWSGRLSVRDDTLKIPVVSLVLPLFLKKGLGDLRDSNWESVARIMMLPAVLSLSWSQSLGRSAMRKGRLLTGTGRARAGAARQGEGSGGVNGSGA